MKKRQVGIWEKWVRPANSKTVIAQWPTPLTFTGFEIGSKIVTGRSLLHTPEDNPVREAYRLWDNALEKGRASWDQTAVLFAVRGASDYWELKRGRCSVDSTGRSEWTADETGPHAYLVEKMPIILLTEIIAELMERRPKGFYAIEHQLFCARPANPSPRQVTCRMELQVTYPKETIVGLKLRSPNLG